LLKKKIYLQIINCLLTIITDTNVGRDTIDTIKYQYSPRRYLIHT